MSQDLQTTDDQQNSQPTTTDGDVMVTSGGSGNVEPKNLNATNTAGPLEQVTGQASGEREMDEAWIHEILADQIYDSDSAFVREFLQNSETACIRACKTIIKHHPDGPGEDWLTYGVWVNEDGDLVTGAEGTILTTDTHSDDQAEAIAMGGEVRRVELPRKLETIVGKARDLGYEPTIEIDVYHDDRQIIWRDNGIGMTTYEVDEAFNVTGKSGVRHEGDTGGNKGIGTLTFKNVTGEEGDMVVTTRTRQPTVEPNVKDIDHQGICFDAYLGGWDELDNDAIDDDFRGTEFIIPVQDSFNLQKFQDWAEEYTSGLRVPVLYHEHRGGSTPTKEEYGDHDFIQKFDDPPVVIDQPGEFTAVAGPDISVSHRSKNDTWLVSMPIDNNRHSVSSFWDIAVQLHDEQGRIVAGPHRGYYHHEGTVYETQQKEVEVADLHNDDVPMPVPTGDRDRLESGTANKRFFKHVKNLVKSAELEEVGKVGERMQEADHPADVIRSNSDDWNLFRRMVGYHGSYNVTDKRSRFGDFIDDRHELPDYDDETIERIFKLFQKVSVAPNGRNRGRKKKYRDSKMLGHLLAQTDPDEVYMAASTSQAFMERKKVVENTHGSVRVIVLDSAADYSPFEKHYGFQKLKEVSRTQSDDHDFDVPNSVHSSNTTSGDTSTDDSDDSDGDGVRSKVLKFRTDSSNKSIDYRYSVNSLDERLEDGKAVGGHRYVVLFPNGQDYENISDHYGLARYAAIAACTQAAYGELKHHHRVLTYDEFMEQARNTVIATEEGGYTVEDLIDVSEDRFVVICYNRKELLKQDDHEAARLRQLYADDIAQHRVRARGEHDPVEKESLFAVADNRTLERAMPAFADMDYPRSPRIAGLKFGYTSPASGVIEWHKLRRSTNEYKRKARTPEWDDDSDVYDKIPRDGFDSWRGQFLKGFHDRGIDPTDLDQDQIRDLINTVDPSVIDWQEVGDDA